MKVPRWLPIAQKVFWAVFLVTLPVTSFPYFPSGVGGSTLVRPLALYPLAILIVIVVLPRLWKSTLPRTLLVMLVFVVIAVAATALSFLRGIDPVIGVTLEGRILRTLISLFLGLSFYLVVALIPRTKDELRFTLRGLYAGFGIALFWGSLQAVYVIKFVPAYFQFLQRLQGYISIRRLFRTRISGMTYEPNWFAEQITFLLLPWLFTAVFSGYTVFRWRWRWITMELFLLVWASGVLVFTYSRAGLLLLAVQLFLIFLIRPHNQAKSSTSQKPKFRIGVVGKRLLQAGLALVVLAGAVFLVGSQNNYFSRLWNYWLDEESTGEYLQYIAVSQRFTYWETAYTMFEHNPLFGVGLGNFSFYFQEYLAERPLYKTPEVVNQIAPKKEDRAQVVTVKSVFPRILAETGLLGFAAFLAFLIALLGCAIYLTLSPGMDAQFWGRAGLMGLVVFLVISFSYDSFSLPNMWVVFGLITAAAHAFPRTGSKITADK
jgi:O-antigen ligase